MVLALAFIVAVSGMPLNAFAGNNDNLETIVVDNGGYKIKVIVQNRGDVHITFPNNEHEKITVDSQKNFYIDAPKGTVMLVSFYDEKDGGKKFDSIKYQYEGANGPKLETVGGMRVIFNETHNNTGIINYITSWKAGDAATVLIPTIEISPGAKNFEDKVSVSLISGIGIATYYKLASVFVLPSKSMPYIM